MTPGAEEAACQGCGKRILWVQTTTGQRVPLDPVAPTYQLNVLDDGNDDREPKGEWRRSNGTGVVEVALVSHFATCAAANQFSGKAKKKQRERE